MFERTIVNRHYTHSANPNPIWHLDRTVTVQEFEFDCIDLNTWEVVGKTRLLWKNDVDHKNPSVDPLYHHCSWRFMKHNPTPVTNWFQGLPKDKMFEWCKEHGLMNMKCVGQYTDFYFSDACTWDSYNMVWCRPEPTTKRRR